MKNTQINWAHHTFNPWIGCSKVNTGCANCYAEELMAHRFKQVEWGDNGTRNRTKDWESPRIWDAECANAGIRQRVFCASLADVFEDRRELEPWRRELFDLIRETPNLEWLLLTKRPELVRATVYKMMPVPSNIKIGVSVSDQKTAVSMLKALVELRDVVPKTFVSAEPLVGPTDLLGVLPCNWLPDFVITGGESGKAARKCHLEWVVSIHNQLIDRGGTHIFKQAGSNAYWRGERIKTEHKKGGNPLELPPAFVARLSGALFSV